MDVSEASTATEEIDMEDLVTEDHSSPEDPLVNLTKAPIPNVLESQVGQSTKTKVDVSNVRNLDTSKMTCPTNKSSQDEGSGPKKFEDYTYTYSGLDIQPPNAD